MSLATLLPALAPDALRPLRRVEYDRLVSAGVFEGERLELLYGNVVRMPPIGPPHNGSVQELNRLLTLRLEGRASVRIQSSFAASDDSEPEPDIAIVPLGKYFDRQPSEAYLIVEVADSSLPVDRLKTALYAASGVSEYWIVNLTDAVVEVYTGLADGKYARKAQLGRDATLTLTRFPDVSITVSDILPP